MTDGARKVCHLCRDAQGGLGIVPAKAHAAVPRDWAAPLSITQG